LPALRQVLRKQVRQDDPDPVWNPGPLLGADRTVLKMLPDINVKFGFVPVNQLRRSGRRQNQRTAQQPYPAPHVALWSQATALRGVSDFA
jgi:hypothetical protein